ncbi:MAG: NAD(+) diphosphatase [Burkholderiaceae bacterium]|nr:NAD(+) diphosphatase [Microbacteriaceae bacterium]
MSYEFTARLALSRHELDRDYEARARPSLFDELWADDGTRVLLLWNGQALLGDDGIAGVIPAEVPAAEDLVYLGRTTDGAATPWVAALLDDAAAETLGGDARWGNLRELGSSLSDLHAGLFTEALAMANWHRSHRFSPVTGKPTVSAVGGWVRRAIDDESQNNFPRTDAAIIVGITDAEDRILLGSNAMWKANRYSLLAGFVEPGESLENAVVREVFEESGIRVKNPTYLGSQPWPFPASIMLGFTAVVDDDQPSTLTPDGEEILALRWFSRQELAASLDEIALPGSTSIARAILERWYGGPIDDRREW